MRNSTIGKYTIEYFNEEEFKIIYSEIYIDGVYIPRVSNHSKDIKIIDIGSHIGLSILYFKYLFPYANITGYEPNPLLFKILENNIHRNSIKNVKLYNYAISNTKGVNDFYISSEDDWYSTGSSYKKQWKGKQNRKLIHVNTININEILKKSINIDILKIDIEGAEHDIIDKIIKYTDTIKNLIIEIHPTDSYRTNHTLEIIKSSFKDIIYIQNNIQIKNPKLNNIFIINAIH